MHRKWSFPLRFSSVNVTDLVTLTGENLNGKLHFLCSGKFNCSETFPRSHAELWFADSWFEYYTWIIGLYQFYKKRYFQSQKDRSLTKEMSSKDCQLVELKEEISKLNTEVTLLKLIISVLQKSSDKTFLNAHKKQTLPETRNEVTKAFPL